MITEFSFLGELSLLIIYQICIEMLFTPPKMQ